jgi:hypothetical protein
MRAEDGTRPAGSMALVRALEAEVAAFRASLPRRSDAEFAAQLEELLRTERDPALHDAIWSFKEGDLDRSGLMRHPAYGRTVARRVSDAVDALSPEETTELHERVAEIREEIREGRSSDGD